MQVTTSRDINHRIAATYDARPWSQDFPQMAAAPLVQLLARSYGGSGQAGDILDLGCGTGGLLSQAGQNSTGRLVGTDISAASCERAKSALDQFGDRVTVHHADILDLHPDLLGKFDLIYCTGVLHVVPPDVRERALQLIGQCLKPGGAALLSYYTGLRSAVRAHLARTLRGASDPAADTAHQMRVARETLELLRPALHRQSHFTLTLRAAFAHLDSSDDDFFLAENLNGGFEAISTAEINRSLQAAGIGFATYLGYSGFKPSYTPGDRAIMADRFDLTSGGYQYALFVKPAAGWTPPRRELPAEDSVPTVAGADRARLRPRQMLRHLFWRIFHV